MKDLSRIKNLPWARIGMITLCSVLSLILMIMIFVTAYIEQMLGLIVRPPTGSDPTLSSEFYTKATLPSGYTGSTIDPSSVTLPPDPDIIVAHDQIINIMLVGQDRREGENYRTRSDAMILCTINKQNKAITLTSFMRDLYVNIPGHGGDKLNAAYAYGGMDLLSQTMKENFGVQVDATVEVDFSGFKKVVNALGGIEIHLTAAEVDYMMSADWDGLSTDGWTLTPGVNLLNGDQALAYSRIRAIGYDFERTERQRRVISAILAKCKGMDIAQTNSLLWELLPLVATDMSNSQITNYARELLPLLSGNTVTTQRIPIEGSYTVTYVGPLDVVLADTEINRQFLIETLMPK